MINQKFFLSLLLLGATTFTGCMRYTDPAIQSSTLNIDWGKAADSSTQSLINNFYNTQGNYFNTANNGNTISNYTLFQYWPNAHSLDVMVDAYNRTKDQSYLNIINNWYTGVNAQNGNTFLGYYYDDEGWNALAMLRTYDATSDTKWKDAVETVWADIQTGWNSSLGGISWNHGDPGDRNAPTNGPACILAARLYREFGDSNDSAWAFKIYNWLRSTLYDPSTGRVYDGISATGALVTSQFTYDQGVFIGAALELYNITGSPTYLNDANKAATFVLTNEINTNDRLLQDEGGGDGGLFKGVFVRYFTQLILCPDLASGTKANYVSFLTHNAQTLWTTGALKTSSGGVFYGSYWGMPPAADTSVYLTVELSGCMLIEAMNMIQ